MTVKSAQQWSGIVVTRDATGALAAAAVGPAGTLYVDGVANGAGVTISGANPYKWTVTLPALTVGQCVSMYLTATIGAIATAAVVAEDVADTYVASDVKTDTAAILLDTGTDGVVLKAAGLATDAANEIAAAVGARIVEGAYSNDDLMRLISAALFGKISGGGTATVTYRAADDSANRIVATITTEGNRTVVILNP